MDPSAVQGDDQGGAIILWSLAVLVVLTILNHITKRRRMHIRSILIPWKLRRLSFFHSFYMGKGEHLLSSKERHIFGDATYTVVVQQKGRPIGIIGFELSSDCLKVYQLQGVKNANVKGLDLGNHLLACAEVITRRLGKAYIRVQPARFHTYYDLDEMHSLYPQLYAHQARLRKMYDTSASKRGYEYCRPGYSFWYQKLLRKRITFVRWLSLQSRLFDRQMRKYQKDTSYDTLFASE